jgi:hypothetical protein
MKKNIITIKKPVLVLRRESIRVLTPEDLKQALGATPTQTGTQTGTLNSRGCVSSAQQNQC